MKTIEEAAQAVINAWKTKEYLRPTIEELEKVLHGSKTPFWCPKCGLDMTYRYTDQDGCCRAVVTK